MFVTCVGIFYMYYFCRYILCNMYYLCRYVICITCVGIFYVICITSVGIFYVICIISVGIFYVIYVCYLLRSFKLSMPAPHLCPVNLKCQDVMTDSDVSMSNLFIYSPLQQPGKPKTKSSEFLILYHTYIHRTPLITGHLSSQDTSHHRTPLITGHLSSQDTSLHRTPLLRGHLS